MITVGIKKKKIKKKEADQETLGISGEFIILRIRRSHTYMYRTVHILRKH